MRTNRRLFLRVDCPCLSWMLLVVIVAMGNFAFSATTTDSLVTTRSVGGVSIDTDGVLNAAKIDELGSLSNTRRQSLEKVPADLTSTVAMRKVSLRRMEAILNDCAKENKPIPDAVKYLGGLQHIQYVFVYPEQKDIVLVGPGEGWVVDAKGNVVGATTGRPVMLLDDLLVALRTAKTAANGGITCSIDPTADGLSRMKERLPELTNTGNPETVASGIETALGMQQISITGVPETSHFARVLAAADYRMKRIAMAFEESPVRGLPSYLQMVKPSARGVVSPRFWLEPKFDALLCDADGLAFELRNSSVKAMTEEDFVAAGGRIQHSGKASAMAQKWADLMTEHYAQLAVAEPIFGQLQNCMDLAVVGALVVKERLAEKAGNSFPTLMDASVVKTVSYSAPKQVESKASVLKKGHNWIISASGGVAIDSWILAEDLKKDDAISSVRVDAAPAGGDASWYWN